MLPLYDIKFNDFNLRDDGIKVTKHSELASTDRRVNTITNPKADGEFFVDTQYGAKKINLEGIVYKGDYPDLSEKIDYVKRYLLTNELGVLEIANKEYNAICKTIDFASGKGGYTNFTAYFTVPCGYGKDSGQENPANVTITDAIYSANVDFEGSKSPYPEITLTISTVGNVTSVEIRNITTNTAIVIAPSGGFSDGDEIYINTDPNELSVQLNQSETKFSGMIMHFDLGENNYQLTFEGDYIFEDQAQDDTGVDDAWSIYGDNWMSQGFTPSVTKDCPKLRVWVKRVGYPYEISEYLDAGGDTNNGFKKDQWEAQSFTAGSDCTFYGFKAYVKRTLGVTNSLYAQMFADDGSGKPDTGSPRLWERHIGYSLVGTSYSDVDFFRPTTPVALVNGVKYHIVLRTTSATSNAYYWYLDTDNGYAGGNRCYSNNAGSSWSTYAGQDSYFKIMISSDLTIALYGDDGGGAPDTASPVADGSTTIEQSKIPISWTDADAIFSTYPSLVATTPYHYAAKIDLGDSSNYYAIKEAVGGTYAGGKANRSIDGGANWSDTGLDDLQFKSFYVDGTPGHTAIFDIKYYKLYV